MPRLLECFAGTGSVGRVFEQAGWEVISIDILPSCDGHVPTLCMSVLDIELDRWPEGHFDVIWTSPPCRCFSRANSTGTKDIALANSLVLHSLALIRALNPKFYFLENPQSGDLKRNMAADIPYVDVDYCRYAHWGYRKRTRLWTSALDVWTPRPLCARDCPNMVMGALGLRHRCTAQKGPGFPGDVCFRSFDLYRIPPALVQELLDAISPSLSGEPAS